MEYYSAMKRNEIVPFAEAWVDLETYTEWCMSEREKEISYVNAYMWNLEKWYRWSYLQNRNRGTDVENKHMDTKGERRGAGVGGMNWEIGIDIDTIPYIK